MNDDFVNQVNTWICEILGTEPEESGYPCEEYELGEETPEHEEEAQWIGKTDNLLINHGRSLR